MRCKRTLKWIFVTTSLLVLTALPGFAVAQEEVDESSPAAAAGLVIIKNVSGSVKVVGWSRNEIHVKGTLGKGTEKLEFNVDGERAEIEVKLPKNAKNVEGSHLVVSLPEGSRVKVSTVSADIEASQVTNRLSLNSVSGDVVAEGELEEVDAETVSGDVELTVDCSEVSAQSVSGDIELANVKGDVKVNTVSGDLEVEGGVFRRFESGSVSGEVEFRGRFQAGGSYSFSSHSGDVILRLPADVDADFEVSTFSGEIDNDFGNNGKRTSKYAPGKELHFTAGSGGADIEVETFSGDVRLIKE